VPSPLGGFKAGEGETNGPVAARRVCTPERSTIHSSLVSRMEVRSVLETIVGGSAVPQPVITPPCSLTNDPSW
jgi:hypothetical protein